MLTPLWIALRKAAAKHTPRLLHHATPPPIQSGVGTFGVGHRTPNYGIAVWSAVAKGVFDRETPLWIRGEGDSPRGGSNGRQPKAPSALEDSLAGALQIPYCRRLIQPTGLPSGI